MQEVFIMIPLPEFIKREQACDNLLQDIKEYKAKKLVNKIAAPIVYETILAASCYLMITRPELTAQTILGNMTLSGLNTHHLLQNMKELDLDMVDILLDFYELTGLTEHELLGACVMNNALNKCKKGIEKNFRKFNINNHIELSDEYIISELFPEHPLKYNKINDLFAYSLYDKVSSKMLLYNIEYYTKEFRKHTDHRDSFIDKIEEDFAGWYLDYNDVEEYLINKYKLKPSKRFLNKAFKEFYNYVKYAPFDETEEPSHEINLMNVLQTQSVTDENKKATNNQKALLEAEEKEY